MSSTRHFTQVVVIVGTLIENEGKFLLIQEPERKVGNAGKWNEPAGIIEMEEHPVDGVKREVFEETGYQFTPTKIVGLYSLAKPNVEAADPHAFIGS